MTGKVGTGPVFNHQPFFPIVDKDIEKPTRTMYIGMNEMEIEEVYTYIFLVLISYTLHYFTYTRNACIHLTYNTHIHLLYPDLAQSRPTDQCALLLTP